MVSGVAEWLFGGHIRNPRGRWCAAPDDRKAVGMIWWSATVGLYATLLVASAIDLRSRRLPDQLTLGLVAVGLVLPVLVTGTGLAERLIGAGVGYLLFWAIGEGYFRWRGEDGLGLGDAKLFAAAGAWLGYADLPLVLLVATLPALGVALVRREARGIAFGPWLSASFGVLWLIRTWS